ncbi:MAG: polyprenyl synthetase family protein [Acidobacteria bacterium]|nr:polyprenyl synthetase family protein [Acidobacteriota bacterium]
MTLAERMARHRQSVDRALDRILPAADQQPSRLHRSMRYTVLAAGKRVRPVLTLICGEIFAAPPAPLVGAGAAVEMVHASSLILDDLPCMDDAAVRRGRPTNHRVFGESTALLAALGLLNMAFATLAALRSPDVPAARAGEAATVLTAAIGSSGLIAGQVVDLESGESVTDLETLEFIHSHKTGRLFIASVELGAILGRARPRERQAVARFAKNLGLAFQITDDLLDATADVATLGKDVRKDKGRTTFATLCGLQGARSLSHELIDHALKALEPLGRRAAPLRDLAETIRDRHA